MYEQGVMPGLSWIEAAWILGVIAVVFLAACVIVKFCQVCLGVLKE